MKSFSGGSFMKSFIGTKIILAEPMAEGEFNARFKGAERDLNSVSQCGYHVQYSNPDGSVYNSWSPKDTFERAYRPVSDDEKLLLIV